MKLRKGKTKTILEGSIESALLAVEIYNKPRTPFRVENYISLMIISWTRLFHAYFYQNNGDTFYYKEDGSIRYKIRDGERRSWELKTCIKKYKNLNEDVKTNLDFFIKLRNKIEHRSIAKEDVGVVIFGECQALLYNYENTLIKFFGEEYSINESLAFSLQFSHLRTSEQELSSKKALSKDVKEINNFIEKYRSSLKNDIFNSQSYSVKLIQIPRIDNNNKKNIPAIEFVKWDDLSSSDKKNFDKLITLIKNKTVKTEVLNPGRLKPGNVIEKVFEKIAEKISHYDLKCLYYIFSIRPISEEGVDAFKTNPKYCHYDEVHDDYVFQNEWVNFLIKVINHKITKEEWVNKYKNKEKLDIKKYEK